MSTPALRRALSAVAALAVAVVVPAVTTGPTDGAEAKPAPVTTTSRSSGFTVERDAAVEAPGASGRAATGPVARSSTLRLDGLPHVLGVSWPRGAVSEDAVIELREERDGEWGEWEVLESDGDEGPDPGTVADREGRRGTAPYVTSADAVEARVVGDRNGRGAKARLDVIDATVTDADRSVGTGAAGAASAAATRPTIYTRAQWGADESIRHAIVDLADIKVAVVHHTAGTNSYTSSQVPSILRGIYAYHATTLGWGDIGYNFLVDRFGRTWEGRWGGVTKPMVGAHAYGYNSVSFGVSVMGDFTSASVPSAVPTALAKLIAWKLGIERIDPTGTTTLADIGSSPTVIGHRDTYATSCPGARLYALLGDLRTRAKAYQGTMLYAPSISRTSYTYGGSGVTANARAGTALTWTLTVTSVCRTRPEVVLSGAAGAGSAVKAAWNGRDDDGRFVPPGTYTVRLSASSGSGTRATALSSTWTVRVRDAAGAPTGYCPPRLSGATRYDVAVAAARENDDTTRRVVIANGTQRAMGDALVAGPLARSQGAVLLLTGASGLPSATKAELARRGVDEVTVIGGTASVSSTVVSQLRGYGATTVTRIGGADRYEVSAAVARAVAGTGAPDAFVASGQQTAFADGLALSGPAAALGRPVLLVSAAGVPDATQAALADLGVERTVVAGGPATVPDAVLGELPAPTRLGGASRYDVTASIADWAGAHGVPTASVLVASGATAALADTLSGGQLGRPILYVTKSSVPSGVRAWLDEAPDLSLATVLGGTATVSMTTGGAVQTVVLR